VPARTSGRALHVRYLLGYCRLLPGPLRDNHAEESAYRGTRLMCWLPRGSVAKSVGSGQGGLGDGLDCVSTTTIEAMRAAQHGELTRRKREDLL
jgi:hypothetical protein